MPQGSVLGPLLFLLYTSELLLPDNKLIGYADGYFLIPVVPSIGVTVSVAESLSLCYASMHPQSPALTIGRTVLKESDDLVILGVTFNSKMTFEKHLRSVSRAASQRLGIWRKSWKVLNDTLLLLRCFRCFILPVLEYCSAVWCSASDTHLNLPDREVIGASFLTGGVFECDLAHRQSGQY